jgi:hypothetical protein
VQLDLATNRKTASDETANSQRSKLASAFRTISRATGIVIAFFLIAKAAMLRNSDRHKSGAIQ